MKPLPLAFAGAFALHVGVAAGVWSSGHGQAAAPPGVDEGETSIEVETWKPPPPPALEPEANVVSAARVIPLRPQQPQPQPQPREMTSAVAVAPVPLANEAPSSAPEPPHFHLSVSAAIGAPQPGVSHGGANGVAPQAGAPGGGAIGDEVVAESSVTERAVQIGGAAPAYPADALAQRVELEAPLAFEIVVDRAGRVASARALQHAGYGFDEAALQALRGYRFSPARRGGDAVRVRMRWTVEFHLR